MLSIFRGTEIGAENEPTSEKSGLYPLQALVIPVSLRFKYHFEGTRQTNRLDKVSLNQIGQHNLLTYYSARMVLHPYPQCRT